MENRKKGYTLVLAVVIAFLVITFFTVLFSFACAGYNITQNLKINNNLKIAAESGIERGELFLKDWIKTHSDSLINTEDFNPEDLNENNNLTFTSNGITCKIQFSPDITNEPTVPLDSVTGTQIPQIIITATATDERGRKKTIENILDKKGISNIYFDRLFNGCLTCLGDLTEADTFTLGTNVNLTASGSVFIQGNDVNFNPTLGFTMTEGDLLFKGGVFSTNVNNVTHGGNKTVINQYYDTTQLSSSSPSWKSAKIMNLPMQSITENDIDDFSAYPQKEVDPNMIKAIDSSHAPKVISYKAKSGNTPLSFQKIVNGGDNLADINGIYFYIMTEIFNIDPNNGNPADLVNGLKLYGTAYKLILIDGDLEIDDDVSENFNNYIIYCTGKVTFKGNASFFNSSILAKSFDFKTGNSYNIVMNGVSTGEALQHKVYVDTSDETQSSKPLIDFSDQDKAAVNKYLIDNIENYGDYIKFKTLKLTVK